MPSYSEARADSADFTDMQPAEYRADHVTILVDKNGTPVMGIILEVQLCRDDDKPYVWLAYVANLRKRLKCPVCLLVVTASESVARWAAREIQFGGGYVFAPLVLGPRQIPLVTDAERACQLPELAVLSAITHCRTVDRDTAVQIGKAALQACVRLEADKTKLYSDAVYAALSNEVRQEVEKMSAVKWAISPDLGTALLQERWTEDLVRRMLIAKFGAISEEIDGRIGGTALEDLCEATVRILTAETPEQVFEGFTIW